MNFFDDLERRLSSLVSTLAGIRSDDEHFVPAKLQDPEWLELLPEFKDECFRLRDQIRILEFELKVISELICRDRPVKVGPFVRASYCEALIAIANKYLSDYVRFCRELDSFTKDQSFQVKARIAIGATKFNFAFVRAFVSIEIRQAKKFLESNPTVKLRAVWSQRYQVQEWLRFFSGQRVNDEKFRELRNDNTLREHPDSGTRSVSILLEDLEREYPEVLARLPEKLNPGKYGLNPGG